MLFMGGATGTVCPDASATLLVCVPSPISSNRKPGPPRASRKLVSPRLTAGSGTCACDRAFTTTPIETQSAPKTLVSTGAASGGFFGQRLSPTRQRSKQARIRFLFVRHVRGTMQNFHCHSPRRREVTNLLPCFRAFVTLEWAIQ